VEKNFGGTTSTITLATNIMFLCVELFGSHGGFAKKLQGAKLGDLMDRYFMFYSFNINNLVSTFKHGNFQHGPLVNVMGMYISLFPRQGSSKVYYLRWSQMAKGVELALLD
jgi:hypothetical protein